MSEIQSKGQWKDFIENLSDSSLNINNVSDLIANCQNNAKVLLNHEYSYDWLKNLEKYSLSEQSKNNIEQLKKGKAVIVTTGQQPCLLTGASLIFHKIFSMLSLCKTLNSKGIAAVPLFWSASEDHDLSEILRVITIDDSFVRNQTRIFKGLRNVSSETLPWDSELDDFLQKQSPFIQSLLKDSPKDFYTDHFNQLLLKCFAKEGLLVVEPKWLNSKSSSFWDQVDAKKEAIVEAFNTDEQKIRDQGYQLQVIRKRPLPVFTINKRNGLREALSLEDRSWKDTNGKQYLNLKDCVNVDKRLSPGALLRPVYAQSALPILASVLGPAEMKYHHQNKKCFEVLGLHRPLLYPRLGGTWLPENLESECMNVGIDLKGLFAGKNFMPSRQRIKMDFEDSFTSLLDNEIGKFEDSHPLKQRLIEQFKNELKRVHLKFDKKMWKIEQEEKGISVKRLHELLEFLMPKGQKQERTICAFSYIKNIEHLYEIKKEFENCFDQKHRKYK